MPPFCYVRDLAPDVWFGNGNSELIPYFPVYDVDRVPSVQKTMSVEMFAEFNQPRDIHRRCRDMYARLKEDIEIIKTRYVIVMDIFYTNLANKKTDYPHAIEDSMLSPFLSGTSLGVRSERDPAKYSVRYIIDNGNMYEAFEFDTLLDLVYVDLFKGILDKHFPKRCKLCGRYFIQEHGFSCEYCTYPSLDDPEKTCRQIGAQSYFKLKLKTDPVWEIYLRAYKKYYARYKKGKMTNTELADWQTNALELRDKAEAGEIDIEDYREELNRL